MKTCSRESGLRKVSLHATQEFKPFVVKLPKVNSLAENPTYYYGIPHNKC